MELGAPGSYLTLEPGAAVMTRDGNRLGEVAHVLADANVDVFDGLVVTLTRPRRGHRFVDASAVDEIYERGVVLKLELAEADRLPEPSANPPALGVDPDDTVESDLQRKLRQAWDRISGSY